MQNILSSQESEPTRIGARRVPFPAVLDDDIVCGENSAPFKKTAAKQVTNPDESDVMININIRGSMDDNNLKPPKKGKNLFFPKSCLVRGTSSLNQTGNILRDSMGSSDNMPSDMPSREFNDSYLDKRNTDLAERIRK